VAATSAGPEDVLSVIDARAEHLELVLEDGAVRIEGPVTVLVGSREAWPRRRLVHLPKSLLASVGLTPTSWVSARPAVFRAIASGERVVARGVLQRCLGGEERAGYRESAAAWCLHPVPPAQAALGPGSVTLAAEGAPHVTEPVGSPAAIGGAMG